MVSKIENSKYKSKEGFYTVSAKVMLFFIFKISLLLSLVLRRLSLLNAIDSSLKQTILPVLTTLILYFGSLESRFISNQLQLDFSFL